MSLTYAIEPSAGDTLYIPRGVMHNAVAVTQLLQRSCLAFSELKGLDDEQNLALGKQLISSGTTRIE